MKILQLFLVVLVGCGSSRPPPPPSMFDAAHPEHDAAVVDAPTIVYDASDRDAPPDEPDAGSLVDDAGPIDLDAGQDAGVDAWTPCSDADMDRDGDSSIECGGTDCDDADPARSGFRPEVCGNLVDEDCSGVLDDLADEVTCDLQMLCRDPSCFCDGACTQVECVEAVRSGYVEFYRCANATEVAAAYLSECGAISACVDLVSCVANVLFTRPDLCVCPVEFPRCAGRCTDLMTEQGSCGMCGNACAGRSICQEGICGHCGRDGESCCYGLTSMACDDGLICNASFICGM